VIRKLWMCVVVLGLSAATAFSAAEILNPSFETDFGNRDDTNVWGDFGDAWGETYQVVAGTRNYVKKARTGDRVLLINVPPGTWDGIWQQLPWSENAPFKLTAYYHIKGGDLSGNCATFIKVEFYDGNDKLIGEKEGDMHRLDTKGNWRETTLEGTTPAGTQAIRCILIAGKNAGGETLIDRIFWDDISISD